MTILYNIFDKLTKINYNKLIFYTFLFFLPLGTKKIFFTSHSFLFGYHIFYNSYFLYFTDLLFALLLITWLIESVRNKKADKSPVKDKIYLSLGIFWLILAISVIAAAIFPIHQWGETRPLLHLPLTKGEKEGVWLGLYGLGRITQGILVFSYISQKINFSREIKWIFTIIVSSLSLESILGISQYIFQSSFDLKLLGEEFLRPGLPGLAEFLSYERFHRIIYNFLPYLRQNSPVSLAGGGISMALRAYGTFPHPNILSGFLFIGFMANLHLLYISRERFIKRLILAILLMINSAGLVVTFSRGTWAVAAIAMFAWFLVIFLKIRKKHMFNMRTGNLPRLSADYNPAALGIIILALLAALSINLFLFGEPIRARLLDKGRAQTFGQQESLQNRNLYNQIAWRMISARPVFGVGVKNFTTAMDKYSPTRLLPYMHQPVHNIYLLIAAESGILALAVFCVVICNIVRPAIAESLAGRHAILNYTLLFMIGGLLVIGLFDHYLWTSQQGSMLFWIALGLLAKTEYNTGA